MLRLDETAVICDFAETYNIYDYRSLPAFRAATFAVGLRNDSRIKTLMRGDDINGYTHNDIVLADIHDMIAAYLLGEKAPSVLKNMLSRPDERPRSDSDALIYASAEDFDAARNKIITEAGKWPEQN